MTSLLLLVRDLSVAFAQNVKTSLAVSLLVLSGEAWYKARIFLPWGLPWA